MDGRAPRLSLFALCMVLVTVLDQATKAAARGLLCDMGQVAFVPGVLDFRLVYNQGAAFSFGSGYTWVFILTALAIVLLCTFYVAFSKPSKTLTVVLGLVAGGGIGNLIDRVALGCVTDFLMPTFVDFAVFNVADIFITCGFIAAFILVWRDVPTEVSSGD